MDEIYVWVLDEKGAPQKRLVKLGSQEGEDQVIESGLDGSETYILDGTQSVRPGCAIQETPVDNAAPNLPETPTATPTGKGMEDANNVVSSSEVIPQKTLTPSNQN